MKWPSVQKMLKRLLICLKRFRGRSLVSKYSNIYDVNEWSEEAITMKAQGYSTRHIARTLFSNENYRNRLNDFFKREDISDEIYHKACQIELNED